MKRTTQLLGAVSSVALVAFTSSPALAAGTTAGNSITNNVSVSFDVGGVTQTPVTDSDTFTVDRRVNVTVAEVGGSSTGVVPGEVEAATTFTVTNTSNDTVDFDLSVVQSATDDFDITNVQFYIDDGNGIYDAGDTLVTYLDEVAEDATITVHVVGDIPLSATNGQQADVTLVADAHAAAGTAGALGAELTATAGANTAGIDTVLADAAAPGDDGANQGDHADSDSYVVSAANVTVAKTSAIISDPVNGTTNPKAIPDAVIEYCIVVTNASGAATATNISITDDLPADVTFVPSSIFVDGDAVCTGGSAGGSYNGGTNQVTGSLSDIAGGTARSLYFRVTIQ